MLRAAGPDDAVARARALGRFMEERELASAEVLQRLIRWFVQRRPNDDICRFPEFMALCEGEDELATELEGLWREHERRGRLDVRGLQNAAQFFGPRDWRDSERLRLAAMARADDPFPVAISLGKLRASLAQQGSEGSAAEHARAALAYLREQADGHPQVRDQGRQYARELSAEAALLAGDLDTARRYAELLLDEDAPHGLPHHVAHTVLGRIALLEGDVPRARAALLAAADTPADHVSSSYGPRLALAKLLLAAGEREAVLTYLRKRAETWECGDGDAEAWIASIEAGEVPDWDDYRDHV